jgi:RNA polymerase-binding transcription factor DksA
MFNFFNINTNQSEENSACVNPEWLALLKENEERYLIFLNKLEEKAMELTDASIPELKALKTEDERQFGLMLNGILGQLESIRDKANTVFDEKIENVYQNYKEEVDVLHPYYSRLTEFRAVCSDQLHNGLEEKLSQLRDQLQETNNEDFEVVYQQILDEFETIKNQFKCQQCGDTIPLTKIYFVTTHLACPSCQNKNTFTPSSLAQGLEHVGRSLAEQRTKPLLDKYYEEQNRERELYLQGHHLKLKRDFHKKNEVLEKQIEDVEQQRNESKALIPNYYQDYERAMFDEWKKLVPDLAEHNERFYQSLQRRKY